MATISLPTGNRTLAPYTTGEPIVLPKKGAARNFNRVVYAATHVVTDPVADNDPWLDAAIDWDGTWFTFGLFAWEFVQHEAIHHGQWSIYAALAGFDTPLSWRTSWGL